LMVAIKKHSELLGVAISNRQHEISICGLHRAPDVRTVSAGKGYTLL
jgi:hypothetical protein